MAEKRIFNHSWESAMTFKGKAKKLFPELSDIENGVKKNNMYVASKKRR